MGHLMIAALRHPDDHEAHACSATHPKRSRPDQPPRPRNSPKPCAEAAEAEYTAFTGRKKAEHVTARLIVRRIRRLNAAAAAGQGELFTAWRNHPVFTGSPFEMLQAELQHRQHAVIEQVIADGKGSALAHLPSGDFQANAAWLTLWAIAHNMLRTAGALAGTSTRRPRPRHRERTWSMIRAIC
ncbi:hypothetical protein [Streptomyces sp. NPDC001665]